MSDQPPALVKIGLCTRVYFVFVAKNVAKWYNGSMSYHPKYTINNQIRSDLQQIEQLKNIVADARILPEVEASIRYRASVESIHSSTSIEGNPLNANEVRAVISSDKILTKEEYAEIEVQNYKHALDYIEERRHSGGEINFSDILELQRIISDRLLDRSRNGKIRRNPVYIENEKGNILYTAARPEDVEKEINSLLAWVKDSQFSLHPVIIAGIIHFQIAAIHPFAGGNGRTARAMTALYLALNQYDNHGALVLDSYYATDRSAYYAVLQLVNGKNDASSSKANLTPWLEYFTRGYLTSLRVLDAEIRTMPRNWCSIC